MVFLPKNSVFNYFLEYRTNQRMKIIDSNRSSTMDDLRPELINRRLKFKIILFRTVSKSCKLVLLFIYNYVNSFSLQIIF